MCRFNIRPICAAVSLVLSGIHSIAIAEETTDPEVIVVSGSRVEQKLGDVAGSVSVVDADEIERRSVTTVEQLFRYDPSITTTGNGGQPQTVTVRGIGGNRIVTIKDGRRANDGYAGGQGFLVGRNYFDMESIQQVEVAKGAASSLYGSDGLGGIVVITTKDPSDYLTDVEQFLQLHTSFNTESDLMSVGAVAAIRTGNWASSAVVTHRQGNEVQNATRSLPGYDTDSTSLLAKTEYAISNEQSVKLTVDYFAQTQEQVIITGRNATDNDDTNISLSVDYQTTAATDYYDRWDAQIYITDYQQKSVQWRQSSFGYLDNNFYDFEQQIVGLRSVFQKSISSDFIEHDWVYGVDVDIYDTKRPRLKTRYGADGVLQFTDQPQKAFPGAKTLLAGVFLQDNVQLKTLPLKVIVGVRFDHYDMQAKQSDLYDSSVMQDITESAVSPKFGLIYEANESLSFTAQWMQGFKIPPHDQAYQNHGVEPFYQIIPNPELASETSNTTELSVRWNKDDLSVIGTVFYSQFDDFIESQLVGVEPTFIPGVNKTIFQYVNVAEATIQGLELSADYQVTDELSVEARLAYLDGENTQTAQPLTTISPLSGSVVWQYDIQNWEMNLALRTAEGMDNVPTDATGDPLAQSAGYAVWDIFGKTEWNDWTFVVAVNNLLDKTYVPYQAVAGMSAQTPTEQYTQPSRSLNVRVSYQF